MKIMAVLLMIFANSVGAADENYVSGEVLLVGKSAAEMPQLLETISRLNGHVRSLVAENTILIAFPDLEKNRGLEAEMARRLQTLPGVEAAEPNFIWRAHKIPNDTRFRELWGLKNAESSIDINVDKAWEISTGNDSTIVGVIDTGIDYRHPDLKENMWINQKELNGRSGIDDDKNGFIDDIYGYNFISTSRSRDPMDDNMHGTHCAGTIGARGDNTLGISGVNWRVKLMALKFLGKDGSGTNENAVRAIDYAIKMGVKILSNSWGGSDNSVVLRKAIERARDAGVLFIAAAGNEAQNNDKKPSFPANYQLENVISVASIGRAGGLSPFSNFGKTLVHLAAPGEEILSTIPNARFELLDGTSMATPHVAGVAALLWGHKPSLKFSDIKRILLGTVRKLPSLSGKTSSGGIVDAAAALSAR